MPLLRFSALSAWAYSCTASAALVSLEFVTVGDPGNAGSPGGGPGAVAETFAMGKYEVTNAQYVEFLKSAAVVDPHGLFNPSMHADPLGGILRGGIAAPFSYSVKAGYENKPVVFVSALDGARFVNWLQNGQGAGDTEHGVYDLATFGSSAPQAPGATFWIPTQNEWFKAAYFQPWVMGGDVDDYWSFPTRSNASPLATGPNPANPNSANYAAAAPTPGNPSGINYLTDVGSYQLARSYYGTFDQGGNVWEPQWIGGTSSKWVAGGGFNNGDYQMRSDGATYSGGAGTEQGDTGFRVATIPEPGAAAWVLIVGALALHGRCARAAG